MPAGLYKRTKKHNEMMSKIFTGRTHSEETKIKIGEAQMGPNNHNWKGGKKRDSRGYIYLLMPEHPEANSRGYIQRAHFVAEKKLGRWLYPDEITHHKNGIKDDDRPENIEVTTRAKHQTIHKEMRRINVA